MIKNCRKKTVQQLKLRASYGLVGNDQVGQERFAYQAIVDLEKSPEFSTGYGSQSRNLKGPVFKRFENTNLTWEVGRKLNVGFDLTVKDVKLTVDVFREIRSNIFQKKGSIPNYFGTAKTDIYGNLAKVKNWGVDLAVDYGKNITKDLAVEFRGTFTFARNKVLEYDEAADTRPALRMVGKRLKSYWGYVANGLYIDEADIANSPKSTLGNIAIAPGDVKYADQPDQNGEYDGKIDANDRVQLGYPYIPEIVYGFGPSISYKKWDLSFFFQGQANVSLMMNDFEPFGTQSKRNVLQWIADDYWSKDNQNPNARYASFIADIAARNHKQAAFTYSGLETTGNSKVDGIVNEVAIQLLRNSVVHGIETPEVRSQRGKLPVGHVHMSLKDQGDKFLLTFEDDGNGIDYAAIAQKAVALGKYTAEEATKLDKRALISLLFTPGFSTAEKSTEDAGRGVGLDIIKDRIVSLGGTVNVASRLHGYTRFSFTLPKLR